jgi:hypothetical protein
MIIRCSLRRRPCGAQEIAVTGDDLLRPQCEDGSARDEPVRACRDHLSAKREEEIQRREKDRGWEKGELR